MAYDYDEQLIEAMGARRQRLAQALMYGPDRLLRRWTNRLSTHLVSAFVAVLICTVCVAVSFVTNLLAKDPSLQRNKQLAPVTSSAPPAITTTPATPVPSRPTAPATKTPAKTTAPATKAPATKTPTKTPTKAPTKTPTKTPTQKPPATSAPARTAAPSPTTPARKAPS